VVQVVQVPHLHHLRRYNRRMTPRSICVLGGTGFVGTHLCASLTRAGHEVTVLTRNAARARHLWVLPRLKLVQVDPHDAGALAGSFRGHDAVINLVGILNESGRSGAGFRRAHTELTKKVVAGCRATHVNRLLQMSGLNAAEHGPSHYLQSKGEAERSIREESHADLSWTIFQPSVIFGSGDSFTSRFAALLGDLPLALPLARADARIAPVWIEDVVAAMMKALADEAGTAGETFQLCGPRVYTLREIVCYVRDLLGLRRVVIGLPDVVARLQAAVMDFVPGKPFSTDNYRSLSQDSVCSLNGFARLGLKATPMEAILPQYLGKAEENARLDRYRRNARR
jgi:NADH dehydrogenase